VSGNGVLVIAPAGGTAETTVTNTILEGDLNVSKTFNWNGAPADAGQQVLVCIQGPTYPDGDEDGACITLTPASPLAQWDDLEVGPYTVTETFPQGDQNEWTTTVDDVEGTTGSATVASGGDPALVTIVNMLKRGTVVVHKVYDVDDQDPDDSWLPTVTVNGDLAVPASLTLWDPVDVPANTPVDVIETLPDGWRNTDIQFSAQCGIQGPEQVLDQLISSALNLIGIDIGVLAIEVAGDFVVVAPGDTCHVTFTNEPYATVNVVKVDNSLNGNDWDFNLSGTAAIEGDPDTDEDFSFSGSDSASFQVPLGSYDANETTEGIFGSFDECPVLSNEGGEGIFMTKSPSGPVDLLEPNASVTFTITNADCPVVLASGALILAKWHDLDGDGGRDGGEPGMANWPITVTGPQFPGGQTFFTDANGEWALPSILAGFYTVSEGSRSGFYQTGLVVNGDEQPASSTVVVEVLDHADGDEVDPQIFTVVEFGNRELGSIRVVKNVTDQVGNVGRGGWVFQLTGGCDGVARSGATNASGILLFESLEPTDVCGVPYLVTEAAANSNGFLTSPAGGVLGAEVDPGEETTVTFTNTRGTGTTVDPTPTNTPVPPTATPTNTPLPPTATNTPEVDPTEDVAGEITPGPGTQATPIPPDTGSGFGGAGAGGARALLLGIVVITAGAGLISVAHRRKA
jgi:hypothetical protein